MFKRGPVNVLVNVDFIFYCFQPSKVIDLYIFWRTTDYSGSKVTRERPGNWRGVKEAGYGEVGLAGGPTAGKFLGRGFLEDLLPSRSQEPLIFSLKTKKVKIERWAVEDSQG